MEDWDENKMVLYMALGIIGWELGKIKHPQNIEDRPIPREERTIEELPFFENPIWDHRRYNTDRNGDGWDDLVFQRRDLRNRYLGKHLPPWEEYKVIFGTPDRPLTAYDHTTSLLEFEK